MTALDFPTSLPDRARAVFSVILQMGLNKDSCLSVSAEELSKQSGLSPWDVAYGLGYLSFSGLLHYHVSRDRENSRRFYKISHRGNISASSVVIKNETQYLPGQYECFNKKTDSEGVIGGEEGSKSAATAPTEELSTDLQKTFGLDPPFIQSLLETNSSEDIRSALLIAKGYPLERIWKSRLAIFLAILKRKKYSYGHRP